MHININLKQSEAKRQLSLLPFFGESPNGETVSVNQRHLMKNGKPWCPVMGEYHFSRYPEHLWEKELLKMKSGGINIVATYIFWIHHEEIQGQFDWSGQRNLRKFVDLCKKCQLQVWMRIGPWAHGECRNGGFPDWIQNGGFLTRVDDEPYLTYVKRFYGEIAKQLKGHFYKDGGPIIGIQLENEYGHCGGPNDERGQAHMKTLKHMSIQAGMEAPFYTATAWGGAVIVEGETLPVWGGYVEAPWDQHIQEQKASQQYMIEKPYQDTQIGADLKTNHSFQLAFQPEEYPLLTAELGGGVQVTHHRRPFILGNDIYASVLTMLAAGAVLVGYYMYHGGTNPKGKLSTLQESKATGMWNDLPELSYDFQAPLREYGQMHGSYGKLRCLHSMLHDFGDLLAATDTIYPVMQPRDSEDLETLRYSVRNGEKGGFLFLNNYVRKRIVPEKVIDFSIQTDIEQLILPQITLSSGSSWIFPILCEIDGIKLIWATAQLLCKLKNDDHNTIVFFAERDKKVELLIECENITGIETSNATQEKEQDRYRISVPQPGKSVAITINSKNKKPIVILVLNREEAEHALKHTIQGKQILIVSDNGIYEDNSNVHVVSGKQETLFSIYPANMLVSAEGELIKHNTIGMFQEYSLLSKHDTTVEAQLNVPQSSTLANEGLAYEFTVINKFIDKPSSLYLKMNFDGDKARMYLDGEQIADWFNIDTNWEVELLRYLNGKDSGSIRIEIDPLYENDFVFFDQKPIFENGRSCGLRKLSLEPEWETPISIK